MPPARQRTIRPPTSQGKKVSFWTGCVTAAIAPPSSLATKACPSNQFPFSRAQDRPASAPAATPNCLRFSNCYHRSVAPFLLAFLLTGPLEEWRLEIEKTGPQTVYLLAMAPGAAVPAGTAHQAILEQFTDNPNFQQQFSQAQALSISYSGPEGRLSFVLLNTKQTPAEDEPYVIAHEFGHLWLKAQRYPAPAYLGGPSSCLSILAGDAVQHVLIREEMDRRKIAWREAWLRSLVSALEGLEKQRAPPAPERCQAVAQAVLWIDVSLGLTEAQWPERARFLETLSKQFSLIQPVAADLAATLKKEKLRLKADHQRALETVFTRLKQMALTLPK